uniref:NADH dehydrogenase subunit 5 n=1 Tax=Pyxicephalus adspersus TaxID=30357 RepID=A0AAV2ZS60_PYXAD|nr:TPA: hypothetical protein GDO54_005443 [Pyxicephalus adspersus]
MAGVAPYGTGRFSMFLEFKQVVYPLSEYKFINTLPIMILCIFTTQIPEYSNPLQLLQNLSTWTLSVTLHWFTPTNTIQFFAVHIPYVKIHPNNSYTNILWIVSISL